MAKALGAAARFVLFLFIFGLVGYNTYEIGRLRAEVAELRGGGGATRSGEARTNSSGTMEQLAEVRSHAERASALLKQKRLSEATKELQAASDAAARATGNAQAGTRGAISDVQKTLARLSKDSAALWKKAEDLTKTGDVPGAPSGDTPPADEKHNEKRSDKKE